MTQQKETPREHSSEPTEGPQEENNKQQPGGQPKTVTAETDIRRHSDIATEGE